MVQVAWSKVNSSLLASVGQNLLGDAIDLAHVFLKVGAFNLNATISVINDSDMLVLNEERSADLLQGLVNDKALIQRLESCGHVAVMHRIDSIVDFNAPFKARDSGAGTWQQHSGQRSVNYCFAVIKPSEELTETYIKNGRWSNTFEGCPE